jgi:hypothetical protein
MGEVSVEASGFFVYRGFEESRRGASSRRTGVRCHGFFYCFWTAQENGKKEGR